MAVRDVALWLRRPTAWLPLLLSLAAVGLVVLHAASGPIVSSADEQAPARIFQLLIAADLVLIAVFGLSWIPRAPRDATVILLAQVAAAALPIALVLYLESVI